MTNNARRDGKEVKDIEEPFFQGSIFHP